MNGYSKTTILYISILLLTVRLASAEDSYLQQHQEAIAKNPTGVNFTIEITNGKTQFHIGETIPITMMFSSSVPDTYTLSIQEYDRSGRVRIDTFIYSPTGDVIDPLYYFYHSGIGFITGGLCPSPITLSVKPHSLKIQLNEWFRFDKPDTYSLYISSKRVGRPLENPDEQGNRCINLVITSNILQFEILPRNPTWEQTVIDSARRDLDASSDLNKEHSVYRKIRFLGSEKTIETLIDGLIMDEQSSNNQWECQAGLVGHPRQKLVLEKMERRLNQKNMKIKHAYLETMSTIFAGIKIPGIKSPYPKNEDKKAYLDIIRKRRGHYDWIFSRYSKHLLINNPSVKTER